METSTGKPEWLCPLTVGSHACFFYTTEDDFFFITAPYLKEALTSLRERTLWILPPHYSFSKAKADLQKFIPLDLNTLLEMRRLILVPWENWYGTEMPVRKLLMRHFRILKETLKEGFDTLRILSHAPAKESHYWREFLLYQESLSRSLKPKPFIFLCGYSLIDCPSAAISSIAANHNMCLVQHGSEWEWLSYRPDVADIPSNILHSRGFYYKHPR